MDLGRGGGSSSSGAGARSGAGVGVAAAGVSDRPSCTAAPPCDFLFLVACSFLAAARAGSFRFFSIATGRGRVEARMALSEVCTTPSGAHWHRGQEGVGVESRRQLIRGELLELCLSRRDEATGGPMDGVWTGSWMEMQGKWIDQGRAPPKENGMGLAGTGTGAGRQTGRGYWALGLGDCPSAGPRPLWCCGVVWCRIGEPPGR